MRHAQINNNLFIRNRQKLVKTLPCDALLIVHSSDIVPKNGDQLYPFRQNSDLFYLTGIDQENTILIMCPNHQNINLREVLFIQKSDEESEIWTGHRLSKDEATRISGVKSLKWTDEFQDTLNHLMINSELVYLYANENVKQIPDAMRDYGFVKEIQAKYPLHEYRRIFPVISKLRIIKEPEEIDIIRKSCEISAKAFKRVLKNIHPGMNEYEVEAELTYEFIRNRASGHAFDPIVASGKNACVLHYTKNNDICKDGDLLLLDFGAEYANYASDTSRTIPVNGKFTQRQRDVYEAVLRVKNKAVKLLSPGISLNDYLNKVNSIMENELINLGLLSAKEVEKETEDLEFSKKAMFKYYMHGCSHYMGLDVHDVGNKYQVLEPGMVLTCEPGIYIREENIGIRLEDDYLIKKDGAVNLFEDHPITPDEIEECMKK